jgi:hypothetical protein
MEDGRVSEPLNRQLRHFFAIFLAMLLTTIPGIGERSDERDFLVAPVTGLRHWDCLSDK